MRMILLALAVLLPSAAAAVDIRHLPDNPLAWGCPFESVLGPGNLVDGFGTLFAADTMVGGLLPVCPYQGAQGWAVRDRTGASHPMDDVLEGFSWMFQDRNGRPALRLDGAWSHGESQANAVAQSLIRAPVIELSGEIVAGDADRLAAFLRDQAGLPCLEDGYCPFSGVLALNSQGGSLEEGLRLAEVVRQHQLITYVADGAVCASACTFVFLAGYTDYEDFFNLRRFAHPAARIGLHRPSMDLADRAFSSRAVEQIITVIDDVKAEAVRQFVAARMPLRLLEQMYATPPDDIYFLSPAELTQVAHVLGGAPLGNAEPSRDGVLAFCAAVHESMDGRLHPDLLTSLALRQDSFLSFDRIGSFACMGARQPSGRWVYDICTPDGRRCALLRCAEGSFSGEAPLCANLFGMELYEDIVNRSLGFALSGGLTRELSGLIVQLLAEGHWWPELPAWTATAPPPTSYCGRIDLGAPATARALQQALAARGFDPGPVDGSIGRMTEAALGAATTALGSRMRRDDPAFLRALGLSDTQIREATLCD